VTILSCLATATAAPAASVELYAVQFPEKHSVELSLKGTPAAPQAEITAQIRYENGQAGITLQYRDMKPALLFAGDVTCYVVWAVSRDGVAENLGELVVRDVRGDVVMSTGQKTFALLLTAEPYYLVPRPSELVVWTSAASTDKRAASSRFTYTAFDPAPIHGLDSISMVAYDSTTPPELLQARKAHELAERLGAAELAAKFFSDATTALNQAENYARDNPRSKSTFDYARRSIQASNEAIRTTAHVLAEEKAAAEEAARRAELDKLSSDAAQAQSTAQQAMAELERQRAEMDASLTRMRAERAALAAEMDAMRREQQALKNRLQDALSKVSSTQSSARGFIVNLPDILFDVDEATLKPEAKIAVAKLTGILLVMPDLNLRVEGHTDSTGSAEHNQRLSEQRAQAVVAFVTEQGLEATRLTAFGYGPTRPLADNASAEGRKRNRRVEIVVAEGQIQEAAP
jgi:outer membrane protein OmpA-like peptidoglycan-associated protein